jgi:hypothetical protein
MAGREAESALDVHVLSESCPRYALPVTGGALFPVDDVGRDDS